MESLPEPRVSAWQKVKNTFSAFFFSEPQVRSMLLDGLRSTPSFVQPSDGTDGAQVAPPPLIKNTISIDTSISFHKTSLHLTQDSVSFLFDASIDVSVSVFWFVDAKSSFLPKDRSPPKRYAPGTDIQATFPLSKYFLEATPVELQGNQQESFYPLVIQIGEPQARNHDMSVIQQLTVYIQFNDPTPQRAPPKKQRGRNKKGQKQPQVPAELTTAVSPLERIPQVTKQIVRIADTSYELQEVFGLNEGVAGDHDSVCVICMCCPPTVAPLPCRHLCLCESCAQMSRLRSHTCPVCQEYVQSFLSVMPDESADI